MVIQEPLTEEIPDTFHLPGIVFVQYRVIKNPFTVSRICFLRIKFVSESLSGVTFYFLNSKKKQVVNNAHIVA